MKRATARGAEQHIILGAGLDSFAYRQPAWARSINILEVDHPKTQQLKLELVKSQGLGPPSNVSYLPIDFARDSLLDGLKQADIDETRPIFLSWLGGSQYLATNEVSALLRALASWRGGCGLVMTYMLAEWSDLEPVIRAGWERAKQWAASVGEPWLSHYSESSMRETLRSAGFAAQNPFTANDMQFLYFAKRTDGLRAEVGPSRIISAHTSEDGADWFDVASPGHSQTMLHRTS
jgi:methyltransferase (TIGR00027 family)